jgi:hypothetical protein
MPAGWTCFALDLATEMKDLLSPWPSLTVSQHRVAARVLNNPETSLAAGVLPTRYARPHLILQHRGHTTALQRKNLGRSETLGDLAKAEQPVEDRLTSGSVGPLNCVHCYLLPNTASSENWKKYLARLRWLTPVILATREAEIRRIEVESQPRQIVCETLSRKNLSQKRAGGVTQGVGPEFKPQYWKK